MVSSKYIGIFLLVLSIAFIFIMINYSSTLKSNQLANCAAKCGLIDHPSDCPLAKNVPWQSIAGFTLVTLLFLAGLFLMIFYKEKNSESETLKKARKAANSLDKDEKKIFQAVLDSKGAIFQSELAEKTGFDKVKVTRLLDRLEGRGLVERRRRGMTNIVILKH